MSKKEKDKDKALEALESALPGYVEHLKNHLSEDDGEEFETSLISMFEEVKRFQKEYPHLATIALDSFEMLRDHGEKLEILKNVLLSARGIEEIEIPTSKDKFLN